MIVPPEFISWSRSYTLKTDWAAVLFWSRFTIICPKGDLLHLLEIRDIFASIALLPLVSSFEAIVLFIVCWSLGALSPHVFLVSPVAILFGIFNNVLRLISSFWHIVKKDCPRHTLWYLHVLSLFQGSHRTPTHGGLSMLLNRRFETSILLNTLALPVGGDF
jgi:hypothetical protein